MQVALGPRPPLQFALGGASLKIARRPRPDGPHAEALAEKFNIGKKVAPHLTSELQLAVCRISQAHSTTLRC